MHLRTRMLVVCVTISFILFVSGLSCLILINESSNNKHYGNTSPVDPESLSNPENPINPVNPIKTENSDEDANTQTDAPVNLLIIGLDGEEVRSDVIVLLNFNPKNGGLNILSVARDTRVRARGRIEKINALIGMGGEKLLAKGIEQLTGLTVNYYITLNFEGFRKMINTLDGVEFEIPFDMDYDDPEQNLHIHLHKGFQTLDGNKAEQLVRYRKGNRPEQGYIDGDIGRIKVQQKFMKALIEQKVRFKYLSKADDIFHILKKHMKTNIEIGDLNRYVRCIRNISYDSVKSYTVPGDSAVIDDLWFFICDKVKTRELIEKYFYR